MSRAIAVWRYLIRGRAGPLSYSVCDSHDDGQERSNIVALLLPFSIGSFTRLWAESTVNGRLGCALSVLDN